MARMNESPEQTEWKVLQESLSQLEKGRPLQYVLGHTDFYGIDFLLNEHTLIPRPETEELVDRIIRTRTASNSLQILDIGTGSGCIALSLAKHLDSAQVYALDISKEALSVARANALTNKLNIGFIQANILEWNKLEESFLANGFPTQWDLIVSNPPYIPEGEKDLMHTNVLQHEPHTALFVPDRDPLLFYREIAKFAKNSLKETGELWMEIHESLSEEYRSLFHELGFSELDLHQDLNGKYRILFARK